MLDFNTRFPMTYDQMDRVALQHFLDENFDPPASELIFCTPVDWQPEPPNISKREYPKKQKQNLPTAIFFFSENSGRRNAAMGARTERALASAVSTS